MAQLKRAGQALPTSVEDVERQLGNWRQYKTEAGSSGEGALVSGGRHALLCGLRSRAQRWRACAALRWPHCTPAAVAWPVRYLFIDSFIYARRSALHPAYP